MSVEIVSFGLDSDYVLSMQERGLHIPSVKAITPEDGGASLVLGVNYVNLIHGLGEIGANLAVDYQVLSTSNVLSNNSYDLHGINNATISIDINTMDSESRMVALANYHLWHGTLAAQYDTDHYLRKTNAESKYVVNLWLSVLGGAGVGGAGLATLLNHHDPEAGIPLIVVGAVGAVNALKVVIRDDPTNPYTTVRKSYRKTRRKAFDLATSAPVLSKVA